MCLYYFPISGQYIKERVHGKKRERVGSQWLSREMREASYRYICYYTTYVVRYKLEKGGRQQRRPLQ